MRHLVKIKIGDDRIYAVVYARTSSDALESLMDWFDDMSRRANGEAAVAELLEDVARSARYDS